MCPIFPKYTSFGQVLNAFLNQSERKMFILERTKYSLNSTPTFGGRLETPNGISNTVLFVNCNTRDLDGIRPDNSSTSGARPVIEILKTQIMY